MTRVLLVDDEPQLLRALRINLTARRYDVVTAEDGTRALQAATDEHPDLVVLDLGLPDLDGVDVIRGLRSWTEVPIVVLSGRSGSRDKVDALDAGADDYVTKLTAVWGPTYLGQTQYLRQYMNNLRRKLEDDPSRPRHLLTEPGMGYRFKP